MDRVWLCISRGWIALTLALLVGACGAAIQHTPVPVRPLPNFRLLDPAGKSFSRADVLRGGLVMVVTAPTYANKTAQELWSEYLTPLKPKNSNLVFLEDMDATLFTSMARSAIKDRYKPGQPVIILADERGDVPRALGVVKGATVVFVYDQRGSLVLSHTAGPTPEAAKQIWQALAGAVAGAHPGARAER